MYSDCVSIRLNQPMTCWRAKLPFNLVSCNIPVPHTVLQHGAMHAFKPSPWLGTELGRLGQGVRRPVSCSVQAAPRVQKQPQQQIVQLPVPDPFLEKTSYNDNWLGVSVPAQATYDDFVSVSKEIMKGRTPAQQKEVVLSMLNTLLPAMASKVFKRLFPPTKMSAELNAMFATWGFGWLVGEMELQTGDVQVSPTEVRRQSSIVKIKKCRYLEASGCVGMCVNMCKVPTQTFFTEGFGLPLTMKPKFEDLSCEMIFGQAPQADDVDEAFKQPCFKIHCSLAQAADTKPCLKLSPPSYARASASNTSANGASADGVSANGTSAQAPMSTDNILQ